MTSCEKIQEMISSMLDGELSAAETAAVKEHIATCPECAAMYEDFSALCGELRESLEEVPASLHTNIMKGIKTASKPKKPIRLVIRPYVSAAACLIIIAGVAIAARSGSIGIDGTMGYSAKLAAAAPAAPEAPAAPAAPAEPAALAPEMFEYGNVVADTEEFYTSAPVPAPEATIAPAKPEAPAEPEAPEEPDAYADARQLWLGDYAAYIPGTEIGEARLTLWDDESGLMEQRYVSDTALLTALLMDTPAEVAEEAIPEKGNILAEIYCMGEYQPCMLYFVGENVIVRTANGYYMAAGSAEDFLLIK